MARIQEITDFNAPELDVFVRLTGAQLRNKLEPEKGVFIAESPTVIEVALNAGCVPVSLLTDKRLINGAVAGIIDRLGDDVPIYTAERDLLTALTGFELTRGALCAMKRPTQPSVEELCRGARRIAVLEAVTDSTNIGALFRSAAAMHIDAVLITPTCCDPLCRRAVRVSMGTIFQIPWARIGDTPADWPNAGLEKLHSLGFKTAAIDSLYSGLVASCNLWLKCNKTTPLSPVYFFSSARIVLSISIFVISSFSRIKSIGTASPDANKIPSIIFVNFSKFFVLTSIRIFLYNNCRKYFFLIHHNKLVF